MSASDNEMEVNKEEIEDDESSNERIDDDDDDDDDDNDDKQENELSTMRNKVQSNLYDYQGHIDYINLSRQYGNLEHLRFARQTMSEIFPLTEQLWLEWIRDEQNLLTSKTDRKNELTNLFEKSLNDYLSVMIWIEYLQYRISLDFSADGIDDLRNLFERALSSCAVHLENGALLWAAFTEVEQAKLIALLNNFQQNPQDENFKAKLYDQIEFILKLYHRQLSIPLRGMESVYNEYQQFCQEYKNYLPKNYHQENDLIIQKEYQQAHQYLEQCEVFENELEETKRSVETYLKYIQFEKEPTRIQCLYERAIVDNCLNENLWNSYLDFAEEFLSSPKLVENIFERCLRNCSWIASLWIRYAEFVEYFQLVSHSELKSIYNRGLNSDPTNLVSFVQLQLAYLQYRRRYYQSESMKTDQKQLETDREEIRHACEHASDQYQEIFLSSADPKLFLKYNGQIELFWIHLEVKCFHSIEHARQIWNGRTLMSKSHNQMISNLWKNFYYTEIHYGDEKHARKVLYRALNHIQSMDYPFVITDLLLEHENKFGNIQQLKEAKSKIRDIKKKLIPIEKPQQQKNSKKEKTSKDKQKQKQNNEKTKTEKPGKVTKEKMDTTTTTTTQIEPASRTNGSNQQQSSPRKRKLSPEQTEAGNKKQLVTNLDNDGFKIPPPPPPPSSSSVSTPTTTSYPVKINKDGDHLNTVFIANLSYDADEEAIRTALSSAGPIKEIRIVKHEWSGKSKGFGYVDFADSTGYQNALKLDHTLIDGRPMYVSTYDPNRSASSDITKKFKYATTLEQNKLFLSNLPFSATKEQIENLFKEHGFNAKDVRIVTHKSGKSKGLGYAEFDDAQIASQVVVKLDGYDLGGHAIKVAISNPPQRKETTKVTPAAKALITRASLGEAPKSTGPRGKGHSQISLVPRKIALNTAKTSDESSSNAMSNEEFRKMLFAKK